MKKCILLLCLLITGIALCFAQTEITINFTTIIGATPGFNIYGEPGTVCTLIGRSAKTGTIRETVLLDNTGYCKLNAHYNIINHEIDYTTDRNWNLIIPEGKITGLINVSNIEYLNICDTASLDSLSFASSLWVQGTINVSGCTKLRYLYIDHPDWSEGSCLEYLNVHGCTSLQRIDCRYTELTTISGISDCKELQYLDCRYTSIDSLNLSNMKKLKRLIIPNDWTTYYRCNGYDRRCEALRTLNVSGCTALDSLDVSGEYYDGYDRGGLYSLNISGCTNLKYLDCRHNPIANLDASGLTNLKELYIPNDLYIDNMNNVLTYALDSLNVSGCTSLTSLDVSGGLDGYGNMRGKLSSLLVDGCTNLRTLNCRNNPLPDLNVSGCPNIELLDCSNTSLSRLNASGLTKLTSRTLLLPLSLSELDISGCIGIDTVNLSNSLLEKLNVNGCTNLQYLSCRKTNLELLVIQNCPKLQTLNCGSNQLTELDLGGCPNLQSLYCANNQLTSLDVSSFRDLQVLYCSNNQLTSLDVSSCQNLETLSCANNQLSNLDVNGLIKLTQLYTPASLQYLNISNCTSLSSMNCANSKLINLNATGCSNLQFLDCRNTPIEELKVSGLKKLDTLYVHHEEKSTIEKKLQNLNVSDCENLQYLDCSNIGLKSLDLSNCKNLQYLDCSYDSLTSIDVRAYDSLQTLYCNNNHLTTLDVSDCKKLYRLDCSYNALTTLNVEGCTGFIKEEPNGNYVRYRGVLNATQNALSLSECYTIQCQMPWNCMYYNIYNTDKQHIYITIPYGEKLNLEKELTIAGTASTISGATGDYVIEGNSLRFLHSGTYTLDFSNEAVTYKYSHYYNGATHVYYEPVHVYYHITVQNRVEPPVFRPAKETILAEEEITISCATEGAMIYYTLDETEPDTSSLLYNSPIVLTENTTIKAIAVKQGLANSKIATASYIIKDPNDDNNNDDTLAITPLQPQIALNVYPNPCGDILYIETSQNNKDGEIHAFRVLDLQGREQICAPGSVRQIGMSRLPAGVYLLEATGKNGAVCHHKIIKR